MTSLLIMATLSGGALIDGVKTKAELAFEKFQALAGIWQGKAEDGRVIRDRYEVIAAGTVVVQESEFEAHPGERMMTVVHLDGDRLILTHYCVARNQPRMVAKHISDDGNKVEFEYFDGTNMKDRNVGHMDKVIWEFKGTDTLSSQWSFYKDGKETFMEKFVSTRVKAGNELTATRSSGSLPCCPPQQ